MEVQSVTPGREVVASQEGRLDVVGNGNYQKYCHVILHTIVQLPDTTG